MVWWGNETMMGGEGEGDKDDDRGYPYIITWRSYENMEMTSNHNKVVWKQGDEDDHNKVKAKDNLIF